MNRRVLGALLGAVVLSSGGFAVSTWAAGGVAPFITAAVADAGRPKADTDRDADRKPAEVLAFAGVKPGMKVIELIPGGGYFTRILAKAVGPTGHVYAVVPPVTDPAKPPPVAAIAADKAYANVTVTPETFAKVTAPEPVDLVWTSQNYHDLHLAQFKLNVAAVNISVFDALKPGGVYLILDHAALPGSGLETPDKLHRIDPAIVRQEVEAAGFKYEGESKVLANPADPHTALVFDPSIRGHTDQFIYKFRKPK